MTKRAEQFLEALPRATQRFVHIEVELLREVLALVREPLTEQIRRAEAERDVAWEQKRQSDAESFRTGQAYIDALHKLAALADAAEQFETHVTWAGEERARDELHTAIAEARKVLT